MNTITSSGICYDEFGQLVLVTQGAADYTLVANKKILFRLFLDVPLASITAVLVTVKFKFFGFTIKKNFMIPASSLLIDNTCPNGPSIGILFTGDVFPFPGEYEIAFSVAGNPSSTPRFRLAKLVFLPPGRLRLLIHNLFGTAPWGTVIEPNFAWLVEMFQSLQRLSAMLPVHDGLKLGLAHTDAGLCFVFGDNIDTFPQVCPSGNPPPCTKNEMVALLLSETNQINSSGTAARVDATVAWRPRDVTKFPPPGGEGAGGQAISYDSPPGKGLALVVGGNVNGKEFTAPIMAQEIGHLFGLEPRQSPHFEDPLDGLHSKDRSVLDPFAFDFYLLKPYAPPPGAFIGDVMNNFGGGLSQGRDMVLYNAFDWEHLRKKFVQMSGAPGPFAFEKRPSKEQRDQLVSAWNSRFAADPEIKVAYPGRSLLAREGFAWHWTSLGFQPLSQPAARKTRSALAPDVAVIQSWLADLAVTEVYAPVGDHPLSMVINPNLDPSLHTHDFDAFA